MSIQEFICSAKLRQTVVSVREAEGERRRQILREGDTAKRAEILKCGREIDRRTLRR